MGRFTLKASNFVKQIYRKNKNYKGIVFLDRDGTINEEVNYLHGKMQLKILPTVVEGIKLLNKQKIAVVVITNQPVVARGVISIKTLEEINNALAEILKIENAFVDAIYSCPHHPERDHPDIPKEALRLRIKCECRKPGIAMYKKAHADFGSKKIIGVIGDQTRDIQAAKNLNTFGILVKTGYGGKDGTHTVKPDFTSHNFLSAVKKILH